MRVGLIIGQLTYGGAESQLCELARGLCARHDVVVYCLSEKTEPYGSRLAEQGVCVRVLPMRRRLDVTRVARLARYLRDDRIEVVHAFLFIASAYAYLATRRMSGVALVTSARNCKDEPSLVRRAVMSRAFRRSAAVLCNSREVARFAERHYRAPASRIRVVYNGVDVERFSSVASGSGGLVVGTVGRIEEQKNLEVFLQAARCVQEARRDAKFEVVGEGSELARLRRRAQALGVGDAVRFRGTTADVPAFFGGLDQFWLTSDWEGMPNVVLEAMAAGLPVVATRVGGTPEAVEDGRTGLLVDPGDAAQVCSAALRLADEPTLARQLGQRARETARERFSIARMVEATAAVYHEIMEARR